MSYTTMNRFCEPTSNYSPSRAPCFVPKTWWPDFGPMSYDYSYQPKMHPTNTIHENLFENRAAIRHGHVPEKLAPGETFFRTASSPDLAARQSIERQEAAAATSTVQFRRPDPAKDALASSTIIQPYKSGGHANGEKERPNYVAAATCDPPALKAASSMHATVALERTGVLPRGPGTRTIGSSLSPALDNGEKAPRWLATQTLVSRPQDAAGRAGSTRLKHHVGSSLAARHAPETAEAALSAAKFSAKSLNLGRSSSTSALPSSPGGVRIASAHGFSGLLRSDS